MIAFNLSYNETKLCKNLDYWSRDMLNFDFLENDLGKVSSSYFVHGFSRKMVLILYSINGHLETSASASRHQHRHWRLHRHCKKEIFFLWSFYFCQSKFVMKKTSMVKSFSSTFAHLTGSVSRCFEQLFCRKPVSTCFWRK